MAGCHELDPQQLLPDREDGIHKVAMVIEYDGTGYLGFQSQAQGRTVQSELERALYRVTQESCRVVGAGRTDRGVHARGQVAHFKTNWKHSWAELLRALNALLPEDICVRNLLPVSEDFHARHSARSRWYRYTIFTRSIRSPFVLRFAYHFPQRLDLEAMNETAAHLLGAHDFSSFGKSPTGGHCVRELYQAQWSREGDFIYFDIKANAFLRCMVRSLVGTFLLVGTGKITPAQFIQIFESADRNNSGPAAPPQGLCLERVYYPEPWEEIG